MLEKWWSMRMDHIRIPSHYLERVEHDHRRLWPRALLYHPGRRDSVVGKFGLVTHPRHNPFTFSFAVRYCHCLPQAVAHCSLFQRRKCDFCYALRYLDLARQRPLHPRRNFDEIPILTLILTQMLVWKVRLMLLRKFLTASGKLYGGKFCAKDRWFLIDSCSLMSEGNKV